MLTWTCETCHEPIAANAGYLWVSGVIEHADQMREWRDANPGRVHSLARVMAQPDLAHWRFGHDLPDDNFYWFPVERVATASGLLAATAHLMEKTWLEYTDWPDVLIRAVAL